MQDVKKQDEIPGQKYSINRDYTTLQLSVQFFVVVVFLFSYLVDSNALCVSYYIFGKNTTSKFFESGKE